MPGAQAAYVKTAACETVVKNHRAFLVGEVGRFQTNCQFCRNLLQIAGTDAVDASPMYTTEPRLL